MEECKEIMIGMDFAKPGGDVTVYCIAREGEVKPITKAEFVEFKNKYYLVEDIDYEIIEPKQLTDANNR